MNNQQTSTGVNYVHQTRDKFKKKVKYRKEAINLSQMMKRSPEITQFTQNLNFWTLRSLCQLTAFQEKNIM